VEKVLMIEQLDKIADRLESILIEAFLRQMDRANGIELLKRALRKINCYEAKLEVYAWKIAVLEEARGGE